MENLIERLAERIAPEAPGLLVLTVVVWMFLKYMKTRDLFIRDMNEENVQAREVALSVIRENTKVTGQVSETMRECASAIRDALHELRNRLK